MFQYDSSVQHSLQNEKQDSAPASRSLNKHGQQYFAQRQWSKALGCFSDAARAHPQEPVYHTNIAAAALKLCHYETALQVSGLNAK